VEDKVWIWTVCGCVRVSSTVISTFFSLNHVFLRMISQQLLCWDSKMPCPKEGSCLFMKSQRQGKKQQ
jgi:hypothetical protein